VAFKVDRLVVQNLLRKTPYDFVKVVGGIEIYNFRIQGFVHFYTNFWRYLISNMGPAKCLGQGAAAPRRRARPRAG
jgi:hypothetical protein